VDENVCRLAPRDELGEGLGAVDIARSQARPLRDIEEDVGDPGRRASVVPEVDCQHPMISFQLVGFGLSGVGSARAVRALSSDS
jgi:hypothetical protein